MSESLEASPVTAPLAEAYPGAWGTFRDAIRGVPLDYTTAPVGRAVIMLAVPMVIEMAMESIFAVADVFWVAHLGADAVATVGLTESMLTMIYTVAMGLSIGAMALVSRRIGQHDAEGASRAAAQSILLGVGGGGAHRAPGGAARSGFAARDGRLARGRRVGQRVHQRDAWRQCHRRPAVPHQRGLPRGRRRGDCDARAVVRQPAQHRARPLLHLRPGPVSRARRRRRRRRDQHRPWQRRRLPTRGTWCADEGAYGCAWSTWDSISR